MELGETLLLLLLGLRREKGGLLLALIPPPRPLLPLAHWQQPQPPWLLL